MLQLDRHVPSPGVPEFNRRLRWVVAGVGVAFVILVGRLWQLQVVRGEQYLQQSTNNFKAEQWLTAVRGKVKDRHGHVLVDNRPSFNVYATPRYFTDDARARLIKLLGLTPHEVEALDAKLKRARARQRPVLVLEDIDRDRLALIEQASAELPGLQVRDVPHRNYPHGTLAAHVLGYLNQINEEELEARRDEGYDEGDYIGRYGIERLWENYLRGKRGVERFVVDARGQRKTDKEAELLVDGPRFVPPVPGHNVVLTLDLELQRIAERALRDHPSGGIAVVEVTTGRILALVSKPAFDPNVMTGHLTRAREAQMEADPHKPFLDKTLRQHYYPGSTYKVVTAIAALKDRAITPEDRTVCHGSHGLGRRRFRCTKAHGSVGLVDAIAQSCNVYFWNLAEKVGMDKISNVAAELGFGAPTGLGMNGDVPGQIPFKSWYEKRGGYRIGYALNTAIGQGDTNVTVLQLALAYAALANGGKLFVPQIVQRVETASGRVVADYGPTLRRKIDVSPRTLAIVARGLWGVVNDKKGTARSTRLDGVSVAGKTGTAQVRKLVTRASSRERGWDPTRDHAWFAGYAPADEAEIAFVVLVEHGGHGGHVAAPVAMEIVQGYLGLKDAPRAAATRVGDDARAAPASGAGASGGGAPASAGGSDPTAAGAAR